MTREQKLLLLKAAITDRQLQALGHEEIARRLHAIKSTVDAVVIDVGLLAASVTKADFLALSNADRNYLSFLVSVGRGMLPVTTTIKQELGALFGQGTDTRANLIQLLRREVTLPEQLELPVTPSDVADALRS